MENKKNNSVVESQKVLINRCKWSVNLVYPEHAGLEIEYGEAAGMTWRRDQKIYIDCTLAEGIFRQTLIHELTHAWLLSHALTNAMYDEKDLCQFVAGNAENIIELANIVQRQINIR